MNNERAAALGVVLTDEMAEQFAVYKALLLEWNEKFNLTAITDSAEIDEKHFLDSLTIVPHLRANGAGSLIDVGTGAGFPGVPAAIALPGLEVTLLDSLTKRVKFLNELIAALGLKNVNAYHGRAEDLGRDPAFRERFDAATARAVAALPVLAEYCLPFVKPGGLFIAMKGSDLSDVEISAGALDKLSGKIEATVRVEMPNNVGRHLILIRKYRHISRLFPRNPGKPAKSPLT